MAKGNSYANPGRDALNAERKQDSANKKRMFLAAYEEWGTVKRACELVGIKRQTYLNWSSSDYKFATAMDGSRRAFAETLEDLALERVKNPDKNRGSDILLIGLLNANWPSKYRPQVTMDQDSAREVLHEMKRWRKESSVVEGSVVQDLPAPMEKTLAEILEKRSDAPKEREEQEGG